MNNDFLIASEVLKTLKIKKFDNEEIQKILTDIELVKKAKKILESNPDIDETTFFNKLHNK